MKLLLNLCFILTGFTCFSQNSAANFIAFKKLDSRNITAPDTLACLLTAPYNTEMDKVRSIFNWITDNIAYNTIRYGFHYLPQNSKDDAEADYDADSVYKSLDERVARITLKRKYALCDGYARLFKSLCDFAGIKSVVITGYARAGYSSQFACNHKWNAVMIDSNWYLLDATWASGYLNFSGTAFRKEYNGYYFLTPPKYFIQDHYPDDVKWTLLNNPPTLSEFNRSPFKQPAFNYRIVSYQPAKGIILAAVGDTVTVTLETTDDKKTLFLSDINSVDSSHIALIDSCLKMNKPYSINGNKITANYIVTNDDVQWLQVIYNGEVVLRYKLNIKKEPFNYLPVVIKDIAVKD
ncbi:transglutaminase domain-containing protein [Parafilimonas terrae]|uniref:Transglutaminase-like superfamily protein n=1 Tax=Parafilimonas terrae TaxID=1465490 RepID=A0A1I5RZ02_9BACT|nr:transglutaminase domain-containing protein [Parafilimonas terrae]SFP63664.1 Transglutaminase-like superfamily protein [Parafilimonas terrae]